MIQIHIGQILQIHIILFTYIQIIIKYFKIFKFIVFTKYMQNSGVDNVISDI
jgi:hypothetical protein